MERKGKRSRSGERERKKDLGKRERESAYIHVTLLAWYTSLVQFSCDLPSLRVHLEPVPHDLTCVCNGCQVFSLPDVESKMVGRLTVAKTDACYRFQGPLKVLPEIILMFGWQCRHAPLPSLRTWKERHTPRTSDVMVSLHER